jgi:hypothetical protein
LTKDTLIKLTTNNTGPLVRNPTNWQEHDLFVFFVRLVVLGAFFLILPALPAAAETRWYVSNAAGMALRPAFSRLALREKYALAVEEILPDDLPDNLREFYDRLYREAWVKAQTETKIDAETGEKKPEGTPFSLRLEKRILYENREATRMQWLFLDQENLIRLASAFALDPADYPPPVIPDLAADTETTIAVADEDSDTAVAEEDAGTVTAEASSEEGEDAKEGEESEEGEGEKIKVDYSGYIELYNSEGYIIEDHQFSSDSTDREMNYFYNKRILIRAVTKIHHPATETKESVTEDYCTDYYRYSRSSSLRGVERVYQAESQTEPVRMRFPHVVLQAAKNAQFVNPGISFSTEFFEDIIVDSGSRVLYTTDDRGRVLTETRRNEDGEVIGELRNTWSGDRLVSVHWKAGDDERITEFEYNSDGDRVLERNLNRGVLERMVRLDGDREIEELYMNGKPMLRAIWENGRKILEEPIRSLPAAEAPVTEMPPAEAPAAEGGS